MEDTIEFSFEVTLRAKETTRLRIEYMLHFVKANGQLQPKIFKIGEPIFGENETVFFRKKHSFKNLTTRKHYPGIHQITLIVNGISREKVSFILEK